MTGWGQDGPLAARAGHDITYLAISGLLHGIGPAAGPPVPPVNYVADFGGGAMFLGVGILAALCTRAPRGAGQVVDAAMTDGAAYLATMTRTFLGCRRLAGRARGQPARRRCPELPLLRLRGRPLRRRRCSGAAGSGPSCCAALGLDPQTTPSPYEPAQWDACAELLAATFATRTRDEWAAVFEPLDACVAPVLTLAEAPAHPHSAARGSYVSVGGATVAAPTPRFSATPGAPGQLSSPGADTAAVLAELGYSSVDVEALRAAGAIG